jgi:transcriptional regulator with XRE-family HTH domain
MSRVWLVQRRKDLGLSQDEMTARLQLHGIDISRSTYASWEQGLYSLPLNDPLVRLGLSRTLDMSIKEMLSNEGYEIESTHSTEGERAATLIDRMDSNHRRVVLSVIEALARELRS